MRVLHLTTHLNTGGITIYIERLIRPLKELGIETFVISSGGDKENAYREKGAQVTVWDLRTKNELNPKVWFSLFRLKSFVSENKIDVIHAHTRVTQVLAAAVSRLTGIPYVTTAHGFYEKRLGRALYPCWGKKTVAISELVGQQIQKHYGIPEEQLRVIPNGVDVEELTGQFESKDPFQARKDFGFGSDDPVIGIIARLVSDKGHEDLIRALRILHLDFPSARLLIVGDGKYRQTLEGLVQELGLQEHIVFTGMIPDVTLAMAAMDVFALPATWREGFGLSLVEAMVCRKPVVVTNIWALNTMVQDRVNGLVVEPKQPELLAKAVRTLLQNPSLSKTLAEQALKISKERYGIALMAKRIAGVYVEVTGSRQGNS